MEQKKQYEFLNTLRFVAVIWIVFAHFNYQCFSHYFTENIFDNYLYNNSSWLYWIFYGITGKYAVSMMCIISGWLVAKKFYRKAVDFGKFIFHRYIRLMLPIFITCTVYIIIRMIQGNTISISSYLNGVLWLGNNGINEHLGYILDFFLGNVFVALLTYLFYNKKYFVLLYIPLIILLYYMDKVWILATVIGGITYHLCEFIKEKKLYKYWYLIIILPLIWWLPRGEEIKQIYLKDSIATALIIVTIYAFPKLQKIFDLNEIKNIKKISYSLFVTHGLINSLFSGYIVQYFKNLSFNVYATEIVSFFVVLIIDLIISSIIYYIAEDKLYNLINNYLNKNTNDYKIELEEEGVKNEK